MDNQIIKKIADAGKEDETYDDEEKDSKSLSQEDCLFNDEELFKEL